MTIKRKNYDQELVQARNKIMYAIEELNFAKKILDKRIKKTVKIEVVK